MFSTFPLLGEMLVENDRMDVWRSVDGDTPVLIKLWKQSALGDIPTEGRTILSFLRRAARIKADKPVGVAPILGVYWLGDSLALVQEWIEGIPLNKLLDETSAIGSAIDAVELCNDLVVGVEALHRQSVGHGDLKPSNIVVDLKARPILIDMLDYSPRADGEVVSSGYTPESGSHMERDRFALTRIIEEILAAVIFPPLEGAEIAAAIRDCREKSPALATLLPLQEALALTIERLKSSEGQRSSEEPLISVSLTGQQTGPVDSDEGFLFLRLRRHPIYSNIDVHIRGAFEELQVHLDSMGRAVSAKRRKLDQRFLTQVAKYEFYRIKARLVVSRADVTDLSALDTILSDPQITARLEQEQAKGSSSTAAEIPEVSDTFAHTDEAEDALAEETSASTPFTSDIDVPELWRVLMEVENELTTEAIAQHDSGFDRSIKRHKVSMELESGEFDFSRNDTVGVQKLDRRGVWRHIGDLDVNRSKPDFVFIDAQHGAWLNRGLVEAGDRLRFLSHFEGTSLKRRSDAVGRVLAGNSRAAELLSVFDTRSNLTPTVEQKQPTDGSLQIYGLNDDQAVAFRKIINARPVGLLQGPPGTGKTKFIAALAHYAITNGLVRNVLLSSQSNEAVNHAAEAVLALFHKNGELPSLLRVGIDDGQISPQLRPFHTSSVEQSFKDRFSAEFRDRMALVGKALGVPQEITSKVFILETALRPVAERISELDRDAKSHAGRISSLFDTLREHLSQLDVKLSSPDLKFEGGCGKFLDDVADAVTLSASRQFSVGADKIKRLRSAAALGRDFIGSASRTVRSFDTFLAGTRQIVVGTCVGLGRSSLGLTDTAFDLVIVDEAARCTSGELLVPLQAARWAVLVGDQAQLQPQHKPQIVHLVSERATFAKKEIMRSDFERTFETSYGKAAGARLKTQYRMLAPIGQLVSEVFYPGLTLVAARTAPIIDPAVLPPD
ncbi:MAG: AAA family ATPase [Rhodocyclaceae bacterium]|nr:AAA family ATPase [Rhodocyclaceae bacterium]